VEIWVIGFGELVELPEDDCQSDCSAQLVECSALTSSRRSAKHL
jgi:hypothetical protein